jgi:6-phosphogluconolactonase
MRRILGLCCLLLLGVAGCDFFVPETGGGGNNTGDYLYVANGNNTFFAGFGVSTSGALSVLPSSPYNNGIGAQSLAVTPANTFLYAGTTNGIYGYTINSNGSISILNSGNSLAQDVVATAMQVDSTGGYLLAAGISTSTQTQSIGIYSISSTGILTALANSPLGLYTGNASTPTLVTPAGMLITPNNSYVYVSLGSLGVQVLTLGAGGALSTGTGTAVTILAPTSTSTSPSDAGLASDPNSLFLFVAEINTGLRVLSIGTSGTLKEVSGSPYAVGTGPTGVILDTTGSYVYVANKGSNNISAFTLTAASGKLTAVAGSPFGSGGQLPIGMVNDNSKKYVAVINSGNNGTTGNNDVQLFSFDATTDGKLNPISTANTGTDPTNPRVIVATH